MLEQGSVQDTTRYVYRVTPHNTTAVVLTAHNTHKYLSCSYTTHTVPHAEDMKDCVKRVICLCRHVREGQGG